MTAPRTLFDMTAAQLISFARGAPSLDIVDVDGLKAAAVRAFDADPAAVTGYGPATGYPPLREWIAERHGVDGRAGPGHQRLAAGRRVPLRPPGQPGRRRHRGEADVRPDAAQPPQHGRQDPPGVARPGRARHRRAAQAARVGRTPEAGARHPELPEPGRHDALAGAAAGADRAGPRVRLHDLRGRPVRGHPVPRRAAAVDAEPGRPGPPDRRGRRLVHQDGLPRRTGRLPGRPGRHDRRRSRRSPSTPTSRRTCCPRSPCTSSASPATSTARSRPCGPRWPSGPRCWPRRCGARSPGASSTSPTAATSSGSICPRTWTSRSSRPAAAARGVAVVKGTDFLLEGGRHSLRLAYSAVLTDQVDEGVRRLAAAVADVRPAPEPESTGETAHVSAGR